MATIRERALRTTGGMAARRAPRSRSSRAAWIVALLVGATIVITIGAINLAELALPLSTDQALYSYIGRAIHQGAVPYRDFVDLKPPGIFYLRALLDVVAPVSWAGACLPGPIEPSCGWLVVKVVDMLTSFAFAALLYAVAQTMRLGRDAALIAAGIGAAYVTQSAISQLGLTPEKLAAFFALLAVLCSARSQWLLSGAAVALAILMKQPSGTVLLPVCVMALSKTGRVRNVGLVAAGVATSIGLVAAVLAWQAALQQAVEYTITVNLERIRTPAAEGGFGGDGSLQTAWQAFRNGLGPFWLLGGCGVLAAFSLPMRWRIVLLSWVAVDALLLLRLREFMQLAPSLALLGAYAAASMWRAVQQPPHLGFANSASARAVLTVCLLTVVVLTGGYQESILLRALNERTTHDFVRSPDEFVVDALAKVAPGPLYVWGNGAELYLLSGRQPASSTLNVIPLSSNLRGAASRREQVMRELARTPPEAIVVSPEVDRPGNGIELNGFRDLAALLDSSYTEDAEVRRDAKYGGWRLYVRRTS